MKHLKKKITALVLCAVAMFSVVLAEPGAQDDPLITKSYVENSLIPQLRSFLTEFCNIKVSEKLKNKKFRTYNIGSGDIWLTEAVNGVDMLLEINESLSLEHRMALCDFANGTADKTNIVGCTAAAAGLGHGDSYMI